MKTVLIIGDSLVQGVGAPSSRGWAQIVAETFPQIDFTIQGVGSDTAGKVLSRWPKAEFDLVILQVGTNDACSRAHKGGPETEPDRFLKHMAKIHEHFRPPSRSQLLLVGLFAVDEALTTPYSDDKSYTNAAIAAYDAMIAKFARRHSVGRVGLREVGVKPKWLADGLHPNATGHAWIASHVVKTLRNRFGQEPHPERVTAEFRLNGGRVAAVR